MDEINWFVNQVRENERGGTTQAQQHSLKPEGNEELFEYATCWFWSVLYRRKTHILCLAKDPPQLTMRIAPR